MIRRSRPAHAQPSSLTVRGAAVVVSAGALAIAIASGPSPRNARAEPRRPPAVTDATTGTPASTPAGVSLPSSPGSTAAGGRATPAPGSGSLTSQLAADGIPVTTLLAYRQAASGVARTDAGCGLPWQLLAAIGRVESDHGRFASAVLHIDGTSTPAVVGIPLDGSRSAVIRDTDRGRLDGDLVFDRAVGPMQFIPSTWAAYAADGNGDSRSDPFNVFDAALAAAHYLCAAGGNLRTTAGQTRAVLAYNHSASYLATVLGLEASYASGARGVTVPNAPATPVRMRLPHFPVVDPAPPPALRPSGPPSGPPTHHPPSGAQTTPPTSPPTSQPTSPPTSPPTPPPTSTPPSSPPGPTCPPGPTAPPSTTTTPDPTTAASATPPATTAPASCPPGPSDSPATPAGDPCSSPSDAPTPSTSICPS